MKGKENLAALFQSLNILSEEDLARGLNYFKYKKASKGTLLIEAGQVCDWYAFVESGILRNFYISSKEEEVSYCLSFPSKIITAYSSFITQQETFENIHAITDAELFIISYKDYQELMNSNESWLKVARFAAEQSYIEMERRMLLLQMESAKTRYEDLLNHYPEYLQRVPLKYLASYLGITARHLSRLRKEVSR